MERLHFNRIDFSALDDGAFLDAVECRGLQSLIVQESTFPSGFVADDLIRSSAAKGLLELWLRGNSNTTPHRHSEGAILDFFFRADEAPEAQPRELTLEGSGVTDSFLTKFFEVNIRIDVCLRRRERLIWLNVGCLDVKLSPQIFNF